MDAASIIVAGGAFLLLMLTGLAGWGRLLLAAGGRATIESGMGLRAAVGLSLYLGSCALLEMRLIVVPGVITAFLAAGAGLSLAGWWRDRPLRRLRLASRGWGEWPLAAAVGAVALFALNSAAWQFGNTDDVQGYLVYVERIFQTGSTGSDPFAYRRFEAGLGGGSYVYALGEMLRDSWRLRIVDIGGGLAILTALLVRDLRTRSVQPAGQALALLALLFLVAFTPAMNMAPDVLGMALLYAMARMCGTLVDAPASPLRPVLIGLLGFALVCLKTTYLLPAAAIGAAAYLSLLLHERRAAVAVEGLAAAAIACALAAPWMLVSAREAGTPLFPVLGPGRLSPLEAAGTAALEDLAKAGGRIAVVLAFPVLVGLSCLKHRESRSRLFAGLALLLGSAVLLLAQVKYSVAGYRYGYPGAAALLLFALPAWVEGGRRLPSPRVALLLAPLLAVSVSLYGVLKPGYGADTFRSGLLYRAAAGLRPASPAGDSAKAAADLRRVQAAVPPGATLLARVDRPYQLDFRRNRVFVADWPGLTGPSPPPRSPSPAAWADHLRRHGVSFVAYSYRSEAGMPEAYLRPLIAQSKSAFLVEQLSMTVLAQSALAGMRRRERVAHDDGQVVVYDLRRPAGGR